VQQRVQSSVLYVLRQHKIQIRSAKCIATRKKITRSAALSVKSKSAALYVLQQHKIQIRSAACIAAAYNSGPQIRSAACIATA
jgi:hypothetical protein